VTRYIHILGVVALVAAVPGLSSASSLLPTTARVPGAPAAPAFAAAAAQAAAGDEAISAKVKSQIDGNADFAGSQVTVTTANGVVTLKGEAPTAVVRLKIVEMTQATEGVTKVVNKIAIAKKK
jgi:hypothetical protein